ncbi:MAG: CotH kinase family protein [Fibrobacter sp.]|nr:CotH kinase family protein [Fibrobacter sp.]
MQDKKSIQRPFAVIAFFLCIFTTTSVFAQDEPLVESGFSVISQPVDISIAHKDRNVTLFFSVEKDESEISYQWYQSIDGTTETGELIEGATESTYTTEPFLEREIRYYYCVASADEDSITSDMAVVAYTGLPLLVINTEVPIDSITKDTTIINGNDTINTNGYVFGNMELVYVDDTPTFTYTFKKVKNGEKKEGIKGRGNTSWYEMPKKGYNIKFNNAQRLFGLSPAKKWCIMANYDDKTLLRNKFSSILGRQVYDSDWAPNSYSVDVVWNGEYRGNYTLSERNTIGEGRIDIQDISDYGKSSFRDQNGDSVVNMYDGGFVLEIDQRKDSPYWFDTDYSWSPITLKEPDEVSTAIQLHVKKVVETAEAALYSDDYTDPDSGWRKYFDENSVIDWFFVNEIARNHDALDYASIYRFYSPVDGKLHFGPIWDFDMGFGNDGENGNRPEHGVITDWYVRKGVWITKMFADSAFVDHMRNRWREKKEALDSAVAEILPALARDDSISAECNFMKWKILGTYVWPNPVGFEDRLTYQSEIDYMKDWLEGRIEWMDNAIENSFFISYDLDGGTLATPNTNVFLSQSSKTFTLKNPTREGYTFIGWSGTGIKGLSTKVKVSDDKKGDKAFKANWRKDIRSAEIVFLDSQMVYNGFAWTPEIIIIHDNDTLVADSDYTVSYADNILAGEATINITGLGEIEGERTVTFTIAPHPVTLTIASESKAYKGEDPEFSYSIEGLLTIDSVVEEITDIVLSREQGEEAGEYDITATYDSASAVNYDVTINKGILTIEPDTTSIVVTIVGHTDTVVYDGSRHSANGFDISSSYSEYSVDLVSYLGDSIALGTNANTYMMNLSDNKFKNTSVSYPNVVFDITDGNLVITPREISLAVLDTFKAYGEEDPKFSYTVNGHKEPMKGISLKREAGEDPDEYAISISYDNKINPNYTVVSATDGVFTITPNTSKVVISVKGYSDTVEFDGMKHTLTGYDIQSNNKAYSLKNVNYKDYATVSATLPGSYAMGLSAADFRNTATYFSDVVFEIIDGNLTIVKKEEKKTVVDPPAKEHKAKEKEIASRIDSRAIPGTLRIVAMDRNIQVNSSQVGDAYAVLDMQGVVVRKGYVESASFVIPVSKAGVYMVRVGSQSQRVTVR